MSALPDNFWDKVQRGPGCWHWTAYKNPQGYGRFKCGNRIEYCHRLVAASIGLEIRGAIVRHSCDTPDCVNPAHLLIGSQADNVADCAQRKRRASYVGEKNNNAKLTPPIVKIIRAQYAAIARYPNGRLERGQLAKLAAKYDVSRDTVRKKIGNGTYWKHLQESTDGRL